MINKKSSGKYEKVIFYRKEIKKVPTVVRFRRKDGSIAEIKTYKKIIVPKKVEFLRKKR